MAEVLRIQYFERNPQPFFRHSIPCRTQVLYDSITHIGALVPAWGGPDTLVEHWCNRLAQGLVRRLHRAAG